jgi:hypothetical protein
MAQTLTSTTGLWQFVFRSELRLSIRMDHAWPGSHLIWHIENSSSRPIILTKLIVHGRDGAADTVPLGLPHVLAPRDELVLPTDVDWSLLAAKSVAAVDVDGTEYKAPRAQLAAVREQMRDSIARPATPLSAREFLFGAADLTFGAALLGLAVFMLMWMIATG